MTRRKTSPFAECVRTGNLYVRRDCVMEFLTAMCDGLSLTFFGRSKVAYLELDTAIEWCEKEAKHHSAEKYAKMVAVMRAFKAKADEERRSKVPEVPDVEP